MPSIACEIDAVNILAAAGYRVRGRRADCPSCKGHSALTVSFSREFFFCHRCKSGGRIRDLAHRQGIELPPARLRRADVPRVAFRTWLSRMMTTLGNEERRAYKKRDWAVAALYFYRDYWPAWNYLAWFYDRVRVWEWFWVCATDKVGRFELYRMWRKYTNV